jgi:hypothetical protein
VSELAKWCWLLVVFYLILLAEAVASGTLVWRY